MMSTVQLAIKNPRYAAALADLLKRDGSHEVVLADRPDLASGGVIVMEGNRPENLMLFEAQPERFVVIARKDAGLLSRIWDAGVRHVVFEEDSPTTALLAIIAAELRAPHARDDDRVPVGALADNGRKRLLPKFPVPILDSRTTGNRCCLSKFSKTPFITS